MAEIIISDNVSLDGVIQDPTGQEGFRHGGWVGQLNHLEELNKLPPDPTRSPATTC